jgi:N-acetylglucosaminyldiphosphoundecaprenol N-acetyl-beta-D-mannosaminyltransferase
VKKWPRRARLFDTAIDVVTLNEELAIAMNWTTQPFHGCRYVVTPNVDHVVLLHEHAGLRSAYAHAGMVLADGWPVVAAARLLGKRLPERVAGSDLVPALLEAMDRGESKRVFLLGAAPGVADRAAQNIQARWPSLHIVGTYSPALGFEARPADNKNILDLISVAQPDLLVIGLGAPKQELWVHEHRHRIEAKLAICAGATIDFLAGEKNRAPRWMRRTGLEWLHRLITEPRRMAKRYLRDAWVFPQLVWQEWNARPRNHFDAESDSADFI